MLRKLKTHFASGILLLAPLFLTLVFIGYLVRLTDSFVVDPLFQILPIDVDADAKVFLTKVAIAFFVVLFVSLVGLTAEKFMFKKILSAWERFLQSIPVFNSIYSSVKEIAQAFFGDKKGVFKRVVFVEYPRKGLYSMGFVTQEKHWEIHKITGKEIINVFLPHPPNPATGFFIFVPKEDTIASAMTVEEGLRMVISAGAAIPRERD